MAAQNTASPPQNHWKRRRRRWRARSVAAGRGMPQCGQSCAPEGAAFWQYRQSGMAGRWLFEQFEALAVQHADVVALLGDDAFVDQAADDARERDRKSTRLNSSH